jgi:hypothetical protein
MEILTTLLGSWPLAILLLGIAAMAIFWRPISRLISRTRSVGKDGISTFDPGLPTPPVESSPTPPATLPDTRRGLDEFNKGLQSPMIRETEEIIERDLVQRNLTTPRDREEALVRSLAIANVALHYEKIYQTIWGSQIDALRYVNPRSGVSDSELRPIYERAKVVWPNFFYSYSFEQWLAFMVESKLLLRKESLLFITVSGREFLQYLVGTAKGPSYG